MSDRWVHFKVRDAYHPAPQWILDQLHGEDLLQGRVVDVIRGWEDPARHGTRPNDYLALEVPGIPDVVLVPMCRVEGDIRDDPLR